MIQIQLTHEQFDAILAKITKGGEVRTLASTPTSGTLQKGSTQAHYTYTLQTQTLTVAVTHTPPLVPISMVEDRIKKWLLSERA